MYTYNRVDVLDNMLCKFSASNGQVISGAHALVGHRNDEQNYSEHFFRLVIPTTVA